MTKLNQIKKIRICIFCIDVCSQCMSRTRCIIFFIDFSIIFCLFHIIDIFIEFHTVKSHKYRIIDVAKSIWEFWDSQWCYQDHDVICTLVNIALFKHKIFASWCTFYSILNIRFHIDVSFFEESHLERRISSNIRSIARSIARLTNRFYVIFHVNRFIRFRFVRFCTFRVDAWFYHIEKTCSKALNNASLKKLQNTHRWKNYIVEKVCTKVSNWTR